ncbi:MAG: dihydroorotase, partial [Moraxellaceae bacterium]|nr:dihydroorotase [Moraxellaceae bacterium]
LVRENVLTEDVLWRALTSNPAKILNIAAGDLSTQGGVVVVDLHKIWSVAPKYLVSQGHNTPFLGMTVQGQVRHLWR